MVNIYLDSVGLGETVWVIESPDNQKCEFILKDIKMHVTHFQFLKSASINTNTFCGHKET